MQMSPTERRILSDALADIERSQKRIIADAQPVIAYDARQTLITINMMKRIVEQAE